MTNQEKADLSKKILQVIKQLQPDAGGWVDFAMIGSPLSIAGVDYKQHGYLKLRPFLYEFEDVLEFKAECPAEGKPPVYYARPKAGKIVNNEPPIQGASKDDLRPTIQTGKSILMALGYIKGDVQSAIDGFSRKAGRSFTQAELEQRIETSYNNGDILYYEYDCNGNPVERQVFSKRTTTFAINTQIQDQRQNYIYAQYNRDVRGWNGVFFNTKEQIFNQINTYKIGRLTFRDYSQANEFIRELQSELLPGETWKYAEPAQAELRKKTEFEILESYLRTVLSALMQDYNCPNSLNYGKIKFSADRKYALFNTGLLSKTATDIIIVGEVFPKNKTSSDKINLSNPFLLRRGKTELREKRFQGSDMDVDMVSFFEKVSQIVYDATAEVDTDDLDKLHHCIEEGIKRNRFPVECKKKYDDGELEALTDTFKSAIERAERIARRNYKYVVPQYRTTSSGNSIQFLMPIYMLGRYDESPDFALVLSESSIDNQKFYRPETVLELAWAYNNARVICKPDNMWLNPDKIGDVASDDFIPEE